MMFAKLSYLNNELYLTVPTLVFHVDVDVDVDAVLTDQTKDTGTGEEFYILLIISFHIFTDLNRLENVKIYL